MKAHERRVVQERDELAVRTAKLGRFVGSDKYAKLLPADQQLLNLQLTAMRMYRRVLDMRIERF